MVGILGSGDVARAALWRGVAAMERAGIPIQQSIARAVEQGGVGDALLRTVRHDLEEGLGIEEAFARAPFLEELERRLIAAGARSGKLPDVLEDLAAHFEDRAATKRALAMSVAYPVFLLHAAVVLPSLPVLVTGGVPAFLAAVLVPLGIAYAVALALVLGLRALRRANRRAADGLLLAIPVLGGLLRKRALATALHVLRLLYASGISVVDAVDAAAAACPNAVVGDVFARARARMVDGMTIAQAFVAEPSLPPSVQGMIATGAASGALDDLLGRAARALDDEAKLARSALVAVLGVLVFLLAAGLVGYKVFSFYSDLYGKALKGF